jgi:hypothetical protein
MGSLYQRRRIVRVVLSRRRYRGTAEAQDAADCRNQRARTQSFADPMGHPFQLWDKKAAKITA